MPRQGFGALVSDTQWTTLLKSGATRQFGHGELIIRQCDRDSTVYMLVEGTVKVYAYRLDGTESLIAIRGPGDSLGEFSALSGFPRTATVTATGGSCLTRALPAARFRHLVRELGLERALWQHVVQRQSESDSLRAEMAGLPAGQRLAGALLRMVCLLGVDVHAWPEPAVAAADTQRHSTVLKLGLSQRELGDWIGLSRASVAAELGHLREQGIIRTGRRYIAVLDLGRLRHLADGEL